MNEDPQAPPPGWRPSAPPPQQPQQAPHQAPNPWAHPSPQQAPFQAPQQASPQAPPQWPYQSPQQGPRPAAGSSGRLPVWVWPVVTALALVVGLVGGAVGGAFYGWVEGEQESGGVGVGRRTTPPLSGDNQSVAAVAQELLPSTVQILAGTEGEGATGSGFVLDAEGHVVTNNHVVAGAAESGEIVIVDSEGRRHPAELVGRSPVYDLAVLRAPGGSSLPAAALGASETLRVGESVVAFGAPLGLSQTVTAGIVSALDRPVTTGGGDDDTSFINAVQTDAAINPGNSGGPLVNLAGEVVGVNSAIATTGGLLGESGNIGVGFAIPIEQVRTTADQILRTGRSHYPVIGATVQTGRSDGVGALIEDVGSSSPAARAGLRAGDRVLALDGERVADGIALIVAIRTHQPGDTVELTLERDGEEQQVSLKLGSRVG